MSIGLLLLPGMDGTGRLFRPFRDELPHDVWTKIVSYPLDRIMGYDALLPLVEGQVEPSVRHVVVAESFSGPLAVLYAHRRAADVAAVVLCASFVSNPLPRPLRWLPRLACGPIFALSSPAIVLRTLLLDFSAPPQLVADLKEAIGTVKPCVLAARVRALASIDVRDELSQLGVPLLYVAGSRDRLVGQRGARQVKAAAPGVKVRVLDAPHLVLQMCPHGAAGAILKFLRSLDKP
jgi:pimeloyl-ACP methyl ester carboxylesterase